MSIDVSDATFESEVLLRSDRQAVVVDLWAPWCGPCRQLGPILESVVAAAGDDVALVKVNIDENPQVAAAFKVQSIPAVFALRDRQVIDSFVGAQGEAAVAAFVAGLLPTEAETVLGRLMAVGDEASLRAVLDIEPGHEGAVCALADLLVETGRSEEALALLERIPETAETRRIAALARTGPPIDGVEVKLDALLHRVKDDDDARQEYVDLLELMGAADPRTAQYRKALTSRLF